MLKPRQGCILSPCLFHLYAEYIIRNTGLEEAQAGIKIAGRNVNNLTPSLILNQFIVPYLLLTAAFWTAYRFLIKRVRLVWYAHLLKNFPLCCDPQSLVRSLKQMFFWNCLAFSVFQQMLPIWSLVRPLFLNPVKHLEVLGLHNAEA